MELFHTDLAPDVGAVLQFDQNMGSEAEADLDTEVKLVLNSGMEFDASSVRFPNVTSFPRVWPQIEV